MISSFFSLFTLALIIGAFISIIIFAVDVIRWHDKETKTVILSSNSPEPEPVPDLETAAKISVESEVKDNERTVAESGEHNSSAFSIPWCKP